MVQCRLAHYLGAGAGTELAEPCGLLWIPTLVFPHDRVTSAAEALVEHLVTRFMVSGVAEFSGSHLFVREINHVPEMWSVLLDHGIAQWKSCGADNIVGAVLMVSMVR